MLTGKKKTLSSQNVAQNLHHIKHNKKDHKQGLMN